MNAKYNGIPCRITGRVVVPTDGAYQHIGWEVQFNPTQLTPEQQQAAIAATRDGR